MPASAEMPTYKIGSKRRKTTSREVMIGVVRICTRSSSGSPAVELPLSPGREVSDGSSAGSDADGKGASWRFDAGVLAFCEPVRMKMYGEGRSAMRAETSESQHHRLENSSCESVLMLNSPWSAPIWTLTTFLPLPTAARSDPTSAPQILAHLSIAPLRTSCRGRSRYGIVRSADEDGSVSAEIFEWCN